MLYYSFVISDILISKIYIVKFIISLESLILKFWLSFRP